MVGSDALPGNVHLVDLDGNVLDVGDEARWVDPFVIPFSTLVSPDGSIVAITNLDGDRVETAIITLTDDVSDSEVVVVDGNALSITNDRIRTAVPDGERLEVTGFDTSGDDGESFGIDRVRAALDTPDGDLITVSDDGEIVRWSPTSGESERIGRFDGGTDDDFVRLARIDGERSAIGIGALDGEVLIVDADGHVRDDIDIDGSVVGFARGDRCLPVITDESVAIVETSTGDVVAEELVGGDFPPAIGVATDDACTLFVFGAEPLLFGADDVVRFAPRENLVGLSGDGTAYAVRDENGDIEVRRLGGDPAPDLALDVDDSSSVFFVRR